MKLFNTNFLILAILILPLMISNDNKSNTELQKKLSKLNLTDVNNLMIVAHSDDESLWGGAHLINEKYLVVCVTCGSNKIRQQEFEDAMNTINTPYLVLNYPDLTDGKKDDWKSWYILIENDLAEIINYKNMNKIVTHNPSGEYGHMHHKMLSEMVTNIAQKDKVYYFNKYYTREETKNLNFCLDELNQNILEEKKELLSVYETQKMIIENHSNNIPYEKFLSYREWNYYYKEA